MDIKKQIPYIPVSYKPFYTSLVSSDVRDTSDSEDAGSPVEAEESTRAKNSNPKKRQTAASQRNAQSAGEAEESTRAKNSNLKKRLKTT